MDEHGSHSPAPACPWCSAPADGGEALTCSSCGATLVLDADASIPGVTAIDAEAILRAARAPAPRRRSRLLAWISGEYEEPAVDLRSIAPPALDVQREILRLEIEAAAAETARDAAGPMPPDAEVSLEGAAGPGQDGRDTGTESGETRETGRLDPVQ